MGSNSTTELAFFYGKESAVSCNTWQWGIHAAVQENGFPLQRDAHGISGDDPTSVNLGHIEQCKRDN